MFNVFIMKKWSALILGMIMTTMTFAILMLYYGWLIAIGGYLVCLLVFTFVGSKLLRNPFTDMLEGKGLLVLDINSTGIINPFIVQVNSPYIQGKVNGKMIKDVFDRETVMQLAVPKQNGIVGDFIDGKVVVALSEDEYNKGRFAMYHYPVIIYNEQTRTIVTKDFLADTEKTAFAEHTVLYLNRIMEELTSVVRDFGRYVVELTKPKGNGIMGTLLPWLLIGGGVIILIVLFGPSLMNAIQGTGATAVNAVSNAGGATIVPT